MPQIHFVCNVGWVITEGKDTLWKALSNFKKGVLWCPVLCSLPGGDELPVYHLEEQRFARVQLERPKLYTHYSTSFLSL